MPSTRLQKILSAAGVSSRRASETLITEGRVTVNGETVTELGSKADPDVDDIRVDGRRVKTSTARRYILMYKPRGYITSRADPQQRPTVIDLLSKGGVKEYVYPVGRLDYESEGLLILTSDGDLAERLMHPSHGVAREYHARVRGVPDRHTLERLSRGVLLDGRKTAPAEVRLARTIATNDGEDAMLSITLHEGRNRQVRRMCEAVGHPVVRLRRVRIGPIHDEHIRPGEFRDLDAREVALLKREASRSVQRTRGAKHGPPGTLHEAPSMKKHRAPSTQHRARLAKPVTLRRAGSPRTGPDPTSRGQRRTGRPRRG